MGFDAGAPSFSSRSAATDVSVAGFAQRVKALATTAPLHDLDARKTSVQTADYGIYQMAELALHTIDLVTIAMDFDTGARPDEVLRDLAGFVAQQGPHRPGSEHERVASWVLENLLNVGSADRGFRTVYGHQGPEGYDRRTFDFKILEEALGADGERYLRASNEAINVLVGALEVDLEAAHIAADVRLDILIKRGRLGEAQAAAQNAPGTPEGEGGGPRAGGGSSAPGAIEGAGNVVAVLALIDMLVQYNRGLQTYGQCDPAECMA